MLAGLRDGVGGPACAAGKNEREILDPLAEMDATRFALKGLRRGRGELQFTECDELRTPTGASAFVGRNETLEPGSGFVIVGKDAD